MKRICSLFVLCSLAGSPSSAWSCPWDFETLRAETSSLPCLAPVAVGVFPQHTTDYLEKRVIAADHALAWAPGWLEALDSKAMALLRLGRYAECREVLAVRERMAPGDYATHANLGTLFTFTGEFEKALIHIDKAMGLEPKAHFGRERYHRLLVEYLLKRRTGTVRGDFLGFSLTREQRLNGSPEAAKAAGLPDGALEAVIAMIAIYGASDVPYLYEALGNIAALRGQRRVAWSAYARAAALNHPSRSELLQWATELEAVLKKEYRPSIAKFDDLYAGMKKSMDAELMRAKRQAEYYRRWETAMLKAGLPFWLPSGIDVLYWKQEQLGLRCDAATSAAIARLHQQNPPTANVYLTALRAASLVVRGEPTDCASVAAAALKFADEHVEELRSAEDSYYTLGDSLREPLGMLTAVAMRCPVAFAPVKIRLTQLLNHKASVPEPPSGSAGEVLQKPVGTAGQTD